MQSSCTLTLVCTLCIVVQVLMVLLKGERERGGGREGVSEGVRERGGETYPVL